MRCVNAKKGGFITPMFKGGMVAGGKGRVCDVQAIYTYNLK
jgi:hypothetical protein